MDVRTAENISVGYSLSISSKERPVQRWMMSEAIPSDFKFRAVASLPCSMP